VVLQQENAQRALVHCRDLTQRLSAESLEEIGRLSFPSTLEDVSTEAKRVLEESLRTFDRKAGELTDLAVYAEYRAALVDRVRKQHDGVRELIVKQTKFHCDEALSESKLQLRRDFRHGGWHLRYSFRRHAEQVARRKLRTVLGDSGSLEDHVVLDFLEHDLNDELGQLYTVEGLLFAVACAVVPLLLVYALSTCRGSARAPALTPPVKLRPYY
jgi:hypothetical protein